MAFVVQTDDGTAVGANAYCTLAEFKSYHDDRGNSYAGPSDSALQAAIVRGRDYMDTRFKFLGCKLLDAQSTEFPREHTCLSGVPQPVKYANAEYALRAIDASLFQDAPAPDGGAPLNSLTQRVDVIEQSVTYEGGAGIGGSYVVPAYPAADLILQRAGLLAFQGRVLMR